MKDLGITKGEWAPIVRKYPTRPKKIYTGVGISEKLNDGVYTTMICDAILPETDKVYIAEHKKIKADMELIADAGNTAQKCGLLPSELLKQRDELLDALKLAVSVLRPYETLYNAAAERNAIKVAEAAIKNNCTHENEVMRQGDGFVYVTCRDCGKEL